jgi:formate hydrogenlyase transcriptional activator
MIRADVLLIDDNPDNLRLLAGMLRERGCQVRMATSGRWALESVRTAPPQLIMLDISMPEMDGYEVCRQLKTRSDTSHIPVIFISALDDTLDKVKAFRVGGVDYVTKPFQVEEVVARVENQLNLAELRQELERRNKELQKRHDELLAASHAITEHQRIEQRLQEENVQLREVLKSESGEDPILGESPAMKKVFQQVEQVASTDSTVLITGETGTGKELIARVIHALSSRKNKVMVKVNCAALPPTLIESELFGHEKGAFTGALSRKIGRFELAHGGTLFLDEIGDLPLDLQAKLLRVLQEGEFERVGGTQTLKVDVRIITATNRNLENAIRDEKYRLDLYYRLNVFPITLPPLRERQGDTELLAQHFVARYAQKIGKPVPEFPPKALDLLRTYPWPGNVRELENVIERAVIVSRNGHLNLAESLPKPVVNTRGNRLRTLEEYEREHILEALQFTGWQVSGNRGAALLLGLKPTTLEARMKKLGIHRPIPPSAQKAGSSK